MIDFIFNPKISHAEIINKEISIADEIILCVAYWKIEGIKKIEKNLIEASKNKSVSIFVGLDEGITEPDALEKLLSLSKGNNMISLKACWRQRKNKKSPIFHAKVFCFIKGKELSAIVGSANVTSAGLDSNSEASVKYHGKVGDPFDIQLAEYFKNLSKARYVFDLNEELIAEYKAWKNA